MDLWTPWSGQLWVLWQRWVPSSEAVICGATAARSFLWCIRQGEAIESLLVLASTRSARLPRRTTAVISLPLVRERERRSSPVAKIFVFLSLFSLSAISEITLTFNRFLKMSSKFLISNVRYNFYFCYECILTWKSILKNKLKFWKGSLIFNSILRTFLKVLNIKIYFFEKKNYNSKIK